MSAPDPVSRDILAIFERARSRLFVRLEELTDAEYLWEPVSDCISIRPGEDGVFRVATLIPESVPGVPDPVTTIAWRIWHIGVGGARPLSREGASTSATETIATAQQDSESLSTLIPRYHHAAQELATLHRQGKPDTDDLAAYVAELAAQIRAQAAKNEPPRPRPAPRRPAPPPARCPARPDQAPLLAPPPPSPGQSPSGPVPGR